MFEESNIFYFLVVNFYYIINKLIYLIYNLVFIYHLKYISIYISLFLNIRSKQINDLCWLYKP
jgi:hypothetical protein